MARRSPIDLGLFLPDSKRFRKAAGFLWFANLRLNTVVWIGCAVSLLGAYAIKRWSDHETRSDFSRAAENRIQAVRQEIDGNFAILKVLRAYFETPLDNGPEWFVRFAGQAIAANPNVLTLEWAPKVSNSARTAFEAGMRERFVDFHGIVSGRPSATLNAVASKPGYFPVSYIYPPETNARFAGYDLLSSPATAPAALRAISTGEPSSTGKLKLWENVGDGFGITTFLAAYDAPDKGHDALWRAAHCRGLVLSVVPPQFLVKSALRNFEESGILTYIFDLSSAPDNRRLLYAQGSRKSPKPRAVLSTRQLRYEGLFHSSRLSVGGRDWEIVCVGSGFAGAGVPWRPILFLLCGLAGTFGIALYLRMIAKYTHDLAAANVDLRREVEDRQKAQDELAFQAYHDPLTGLPNRRQFSLRFEQAIERAKRSGESLALLFVDLDGFKIINDTLGHAFGDAVLKAVGERFSQSIGRQDVVARTGGDEFNLLLGSAGSGVFADRVAQGLLDTLSQPCEIGGRTLTLSASIGVSIFPAHGDDFQELAHCADSAMYVAKKRGKNRFYHYSPELAVTTRRGMELALSLRGAIERDELCLFFQPIIGLGAEPSLRFEALLRWRHPRSGLLGPGHFFSVAEETGLTAPIGRWVLNEACRAAAQWQQHSNYEIGVSVNVSGLQFSRTDFIESVDTALAISGLRPSLLEIEITESSVVGEIEEAIPRLAALRRKGIKIAVDDFGTGFSSLSYLETLPIDTIKIDRSFVPKSQNHFRRWSLLRSLIALGRSMNLRVVLEGIEAAHQFERVVRDMEPSEVQGFLFAKPLSTSAAVEFIEQWNRKQGTPEVERLMESVRPPADLILVKARSQAV